MIISSSLCSSNISHQKVDSILGLGKDFASNNHEVSPLKNSSVYVGLLWLNILKGGGSIGQAVFFGREGFVFSSVFPMFNNSEFRENDHFGIFH